MKTRGPNGALITACFAFAVMAGCFAESEERSLLPKMRRNQLEKPRLQYCGGTQWFVHCSGGLVISVRRNSADETLATLLFRTNGVEIAALAAYDIKRRTAKVLAGYETAQQWHCSTFHLATFDADGRVLSNRMMFTKTENLDAEWNYLDLNADGRWDVRSLLNCRAAEEETDATVKRQEIHLRGAWIEAAETNGVYAVREGDKDRHFVFEGDEFREIGEARSVIEEK